jgi:hypothetical protein
MGPSSAVKAGYDSHYAGVGNLQGIVDGGKHGFAAMKSFSPEFKGQRPCSVYQFLFGFFPHGNRLLRLQLQIPSFFLAPHLHSIFSVYTFL